MNFTIQENSSGWTGPPMKLSTALKCTYPTSQRSSKSKYISADIPLQIDKPVLSPVRIIHSRLNDIRIVPIMVGVTRPTSERMYGELLAKYLADASTLFVISSDFCHW